MVNINITISIIILNINGLNSLIKRLLEWVKTQLYVVHKKPTLNIKIHID